MEDFETYSNELAEAGQIIARNLGEFLVKPRELISENVNPLFADNAVLHALYTILAAHVSYIVARSSGITSLEKRKEIDDAIKYEIGRTLQKLMADHISGTDATIVFYEKEKKKE